MAAMINVKRVNFLDFLPLMRREALMFRRHLLCCLAVCATMLGSGAAAEPLLRLPDFTMACRPGPGCRAQASPGAPDRDVRPFEGSLGRPCGWRWRPTPSGTRKVRVCY
ncbi:hypothetical protein [Methylobacterium nigriterrae]|uniref:hypothetical protein n=1 Tax=Methylobacterium nigriterrae TaxID=3127512 RepID=UPI003013FF2D